MPAPNDHGSVTAELAIALPSVALVIAVTLSAFGLQIERMKLVGLAAVAARAAGRGEADDFVRGLVRAGDSVANIKINYLDDLVCVTLSNGFRIASLPPIDIAERQCARKGGL